MTFQLDSIVTTGRLVIKQGIAMLAGVCLFSGVAIGAEHKFSDRYSMEVDPRNLVDHHCSCTCLEA